MDRREIIQARKEERSIRKLYASDYLLGVHDGGRQGALRFRIDPEGPFIAQETELAARPITEVHRLERASLSLEASKDPYEEKWFRDLITPGSSLGGARPKANVIDEKGVMWIAKFPSANDEWDVGAWEFLASRLAAAAGLCFASSAFGTARYEYKVVPLGSLTSLQKSKEAASRTEQVEELLDCIKTAYENKEKQYFLGSIVYRKNDKDSGDMQYTELELLDGQQRITTMFLMFAAMRDVVLENKIKFDEAEFNGITKNCIKLIYQIGRASCRERV